MDKNTIQELLKALPIGGIERAPEGLGQEIKAHIPPRLIRHRMDVINIIVDLRISRLAAAAAIIVTMLVIGIFFGGRDAIGRHMLQDSKLFLKYTLGGEEACKTDVLSGLTAFRDNLIAQGRDVVFYANTVNPKDRYTVIMHWKLADDKYGVILGDLSACTVSAKTLIRLQAHTLQQNQDK